MAIGNDTRIGQIGVPPLLDRGSGASHPAPQSRPDGAPAPAPAGDAAARVDRGEAQLATDAWEGVIGARRFGAEPGFQAQIAAQPLAQALDAAVAGVLAPLR